jgi:hypothetical protein
MNTSNLNWDGMADVATSERTFGRYDHPFVGDTLPNGATVIAYHHGIGEGYVLAYAEKGVSKHEYVTWHYVIEQDLHCRNRLETYSGHYFDSIMRATRDFARRIGADAA